jgi:quercetin dioxygenase-like cupin family protein
MTHATHTRQTAPFRWEDIPVLAYKEDGGTHFRNVTRQVLFEGGNHLQAQLRYFEIGPGGHSTLEHHDHVHSVMIVRGSGRVMVGGRVHRLKPFDLIYVPPRTWHQFRATARGRLGFLCLVRSERDRPQRPAQADLAALRRDPRIAAFIRV